MMKYIVLLVFLSVTSFSYGQDSVQIKVKVHYLSDSTLFKDAQITILSSSGDKVKHLTNKSGLVDVSLRCDCSYVIECEAKGHYKEKLKIKNPCNPDDDIDIHFYMRKLKVYGGAD